MTNPGNGKNEVNGNPRGSSGSSKQGQDIADVMDAFKDIFLTADSGAILATDWQSETLVGDQGRDTRRTRGNENFSADGKVKGPNRSQRGNTTGFYEDASSRGKNRKSEDNDGRIYATNNTRNHDVPNDYYMVNGGYRDSNKGTNTSRSGSTDNYMNNNNTSNTYDHSPSNENNVMDWSDDDEHTKHLTPSSTVPQQTSCNNITPSQDVGDDESSVASRISAWHEIADPKAKERSDGVGTGQLHRKGRNYRPVDEKTVLEIQQRGKIIKRTKRSRESLGGKNLLSTKSGSFPRGVSPRSDNPSPKHDASLLNSSHSEPTAQRKQPAQQRPSPSPPSSSPKPSSQAQPPQQNAPEMDQPKLDNNTATFREFTQGSPQKAQTITKPSQQSQYYRHQSPARSQKYLPYIPPEFDSTPYRKQPSPLPLPVNHRGDRNGNGYEDQEDCDQSSEATTEYYEESENEGGDRGELLLTINVELQEGENPHAIYVRMRDDPLDLAREFCVKWKVTNDVVEPALADLIREEKAKRLGDD